MDLKCTSVWIVLGYFNEQNQFIDFLFQELSKNFHVIDCCKGVEEGIIRESGNQYSKTLLLTNAQKIICDNNTPLLILAGEEPVPIEHTPTKSTVIFRAEKPVVINSLVTYLEGIEFIDCGVEGFCTVTFSSHTHDSTVVSLQRSVISFDGQKIYPWDWPFKSQVDGLPDYFPLFLAAIYAKLGVSPD